MEKMIKNFDQFNEAKSSKEGKMFSKKDLKSAMSAIEKSKKAESVEFKKAFNSIKTSLEEHQAQTDTKITKKMIKDSIKEMCPDFSKEKSTDLYNDLLFLTEGFSFPLKASMVMMSHLSDMGEGMMDNKELNVRSNFVKFLIMKYPNTDVEIDADADWQEFTTKFPQFAQ